MPPKKSAVAHLGKAVQCGDAYRARVQYYDKEGRNKSVIGPRRIELAEAQADMDAMHELMHCSYFELILALNRSVGINNRFQTD